jgi:glycosyltransferase involved in cell wall biosynthesis
VRQLAVISSVNEFARIKQCYPNLWGLEIHEFESAATATLALKTFEYDCVLLAGVPFDGDVGNLLREAHRMYVPSVYWLEPISASQHPSDVVQLVRLCDFSLCPTLETCHLASKEKANILAVHSNSDDQTQGLNIWKRIPTDFKMRHFPRVSIVTILYNKASEISYVLESYARQTYEGSIEFIFVDDQSTDQSVALVEEYMVQLPALQNRIEYKIISNDRNLGNCLSRNIGVEQATGEIVVIVDADCLLNADFVRRHVEAHAFNDDEIVIGPLNIETNGAEPKHVLRYYEERPWLAVAHADLQDPVNRVSFVNCVTRNFSIKAKAIGEELFDALFSYSANPDSGYGWEDIEMGYRQYRRGLRVKFVEEAFSIHITPSKNDDGESKCLRSMKNFRRLYEKHPELGWVVRRWSFKTFQKICEWAEKTGTEINEDRRFLEKYFQQLNGPPVIRLIKKRYRVLSYRWHVPHQYELYKLPIDVTLVTALGSPMTHSWEYGQRPQPPNVRFVRAEDIDIRDYDFAILHFDENVLSYGNTNGVIGPDWGAAFSWMRDNVDLPKVAICHGTPQFYGQYNMDYSGTDLLKVIEHERVRLVDYLGSIPTVLNSHQAKREWGFRNSRVIWHGFDPTEFPPATYERGILSHQGPLVTSRPHYRGYFLHREVFADFPADAQPQTLKVPEPHVLYSGNTYATAKFRNYVDEIRRYSIYFNPTQRSPMPRARCEPMMCGVVTVSAHNHDIDMFIRNGVNGFYSSDPEELRRILIDLVRHPAAVRQIGAESRKTALDIFNYDRYLADWHKLISDIIG